MRAAPPSRHLTVGGWQVVKGERKEAKWDLLASIGNVRKVYRIEVVFASCMILTGVSPYLGSQLHV